MSSRQHPWWDSKRPKGFRFSIIDAVIVVGCTVVTLGLWPMIGSLAWLCPAVLGHFFLFCNVFRVGTRRELIWAGMLFLNVVVWLAIGKGTPERIFLTQIPITILTIITALRSSDYHGLGCTHFGKTS